MKYYIIYFLSAVFLVFLWFGSAKNSASPEVAISADSTQISFDTVSPPVPKKDTVFIINEPQVHYIKEDGGGTIGFTNELITMFVGLANLVLIVIQIKNKGK